MKATFVTMIVHLSPDFFQFSHQTHIIIFDQIRIPDSDELIKSLRQIA